MAQYLKMFLIMCLILIITTEIIAEKKTEQKSNKNNKSGGQKRTETARPPISAYCRLKPKSAQCGLVIRSIPGLPDQQEVMDTIISFALDALQQFTNIRDLIFGGNGDSDFRRKRSIADGIKSITNKPTKQQNRPKGILYRLQSIISGGKIDIE